MPSYTFNITEKCVSYIKMCIKDMPGNPGQEVLVNDLDFSGCRFLVNVDLVRYPDPNPSIDVSSNYDIDIKSNHPEAIEIIIDTAEQYGEEIAYQSTVLGPFKFIDALETGDWKVVGLDIVDPEGRIIGTG